MLKRTVLTAMLLVCGFPAWAADGTIDTLSAGSAIGGTESIPMFQTANPAVKTTPSALDTYLAQTTKTLTNKTINCANNTCTVRIGSDVSGLGTGVAAFLGTPSSANLAAALTDETGSGAAVFGTSPTLVTPVLGVAAATSINKVALTTPATSATLTIADGKTLTDTSGLGAVALKGATGGGFAQAASTDLSDSSGLGRLAANNAWTAGQAVTPDTASSCGTQSAAGTMTPNFAISNSCAATFGAGNLTIANPSNVKAGQSYIISLTQDGTGGRTVTWGSQYKWPSGTAPTLSTGAGAVDVISCWFPTTSIGRCNLAQANSG